MYITMIITKKNIGDIHCIQLNFSLCRIFESWDIYLVYSTWNGTEEWHPSINTEEHNQNIPLLIT